ncbi:MAG: hypothetical protein GF334_12355 [Candidatus Altiarchaeales archaeon]|nr:hypothetical protein [Candidatus Altiarchaeales archaeon]
MDIMNEYTPGMIRKFYRACVIRRSEALLDNATASRFGQATEKSWRTVQQEVRRSIDGLMNKAAPKTAAAVRRGDADLNNFFGMVTRDKKGSSKSLTRRDIKDAGT